MEKLKTYLIYILVIGLGSIYALGGLIGSIYWAIQNNLLNVVFSIFIPLYGAISVIINLIK